MFTPGMPGPIELCGGLIPPPKLWGLGPMGPIPLGTFILCIGPLDGERRSQISLCRLDALKHLNVIIDEGSPCSLGSMFGSIGWAVGTPPGG